MDNNCTQIVRGDVEYGIDIIELLEKHKLLEYFKQIIKNM